MSGAGPQLLCYRTYMYANRAEKQEDGMIFLCAPVHGRKEYDKILVSVYLSFFGKIDKTQLAFQRQPNLRVCVQARTGYYRRP